MASHTYRSFAIYLVIVFILSESPISAFTLRRTTTLKSLYDLTGEESALLEVKSVLSKLHDEKDNIRHGRDKPHIRKPINLLSPEKKSGFANRKSLLASSNVDPVNKNEDELKPSNEMLARELMTATNEQKDTNKTKNDADLEIRRYIKALASGSYSDPKTSESTSPAVSTKKQDLAQNQTYKEEKTDITEKTSLRVETTPFVTEEVKTTASEITTVDVPLEFSSREVPTTIGDENNSSETTQLVFTSPGTEILANTNTRASIESDTPTYLTGITEPMVTKNPSWKKYTTIERKRTMPSTETEYTVSDKTEELEKAESVSSKITLENAISVTPIHSLEELRQELISNSKTATMKNKEKDDYLTTHPIVNTIRTETELTTSTMSIDRDVTTAEKTDFDPSTRTGHYESEPKLLTSTMPMDKDVITEEKTDYVTSKRAGYLDFSKHSTVNAEVTTEYLEDKTGLNETELLGAIFEIEMQEEPDLKNSTIVESQSQLADDAIKEELLKEKVLNDHVVNSKRQENQQDPDKVKPLDSGDTEETLSVKPIAGKGSLYAVNSNYKKMKKIEVQPSKPFVRDPDDNSWRNESLTSLGIVFKAKNASKPFTQVLKNKTEAEFNVIQTERENTNEVPDLRQRLEKIAEVRKSRKKKIDKFGDTVYSDYEETSGETSSTPKTDTVSIPVMEVAGEVFFAPTPLSPGTEATQRTTEPGVYMHSKETTTKKPKKINKFSEYYDTTDEYDADYINLSKIDLKKFTTRLAQGGMTVTTSPFFSHFTKPMSIQPLQDRQPTVQYFPPRENKRKQPPKQQTPPDPALQVQLPQKVNMNDYDADFQGKVNLFSQDKTAKDAAPVTYATLPPATMVQEKPVQHHKLNSVIPAYPAHQYKPGNLDKNVYDTFPPRAAEHANRYPGSNDEGFNRASYVIKHYKDLINEAVKADYDKSGEYMPPFTESPLAGFTAMRDGPMKHLDEDYDYEANFRKDILSRFVDNFNQNSERFKVDFPILYNNTVVHMKTQENGKVVASSSAFLKRMYGEGGCGARCERVELAPAYELHYYVPEQEERAEPDLKPTLPYAYPL